MKTIVLLLICIALFTACNQQPPVSNTVNIPPCSVPEDQRAPDMTIEPQGFEQVRQFLTTAVGIENPYSWGDKDGWQHRITLKRDGSVAVYFWNVDQPVLPPPFYAFYCNGSVFTAKNHIGLVKNDLAKLIEYAELYNRSVKQQPANR